MNSIECTVPKATLPLRSKFSKKCSSYKELKDTLTLFMPLFMVVTLDFKFISPTPWILLNRIGIVKSSWCLSFSTQSQQLSVHRFAAQFLAVPPFHLLQMFSMQLNAWTVSLLQRLHPRHSLRLNRRRFLPLRLQCYLPLTKDLAVIVIPQMIMKGIA